MSSEVNMSNQTKQKRPKYTIEFKQDAAKSKTSGKAGGLKM
jgi:hypothetical protein